jgi:hypothetical protein
MESLNLRAKPDASLPRDSESLNIRFTICISSPGESVKFSPIRIPNMPHKTIKSQLFLLSLCAIVLALFEFEKTRANVLRFFQLFINS